MCFNNVRPHTCGEDYPAMQMVAELDRLLNFIDKGKYDVQIHAMTT